ncbi:cohesin domain-containing protein [Geoalkalibacter halelectricus]|nr:cohesin domain-containing protein [Geoalkalibacter halelectricus]
MNILMTAFIRRPLALALVVLMLLSGCAPGLPAKSQTSGENLMARGQYDLAVAEFLRAVEADPGSQSARLNLQKASYLAAREHHRRGRDLAAQGHLTEAINEMQVALAYDPSLEIARQDLEGVRRQMRSQRLTDDAETFFRERKFVHARRVLNRALELDSGNRRARGLLERVERSHIAVLDGHELEIASDKPITLRFQDANLQDVFNVLSQLSGINFIFDEDVRAERISVYLEDATFAQALELLLKMKGLNRKVLNPKTIFLFGKGREKQFEDQIIQTFYLSNIDARKAVNLLRTMLQLRRIFVHEELNALVIRDTPEVIRLSQQILEAADRADSEVIFDVELIEVSYGDESRLGTELSAYSLSLGLGRGGRIVSDGLSPGSSTENLVRSLSSLDTFYTLPSATFDFAKTLQDTEVLASPKIRVKNRERAKVHIGSREPVITVTLTGDTQRSDNVQYVDVGVKLNVEPVIQLDNTVVTNLSLEVSSITDRRTLPSGTSVFTITTTNAESVLTLRDGERTVIGGLIRDDKNRTTRSVPLLGDLPLLGSLFTHHQDRTQKREILLSITPHILKSLEMPLPEVATIWSGGEDEFRAGPNFGAFMPDFAPELEKANPAAVPRLVEPRPVSLPVPETRVEEPLEALLPVMTPPAPVTPPPAVAPPPTPVTPPPAVLPPPERPAPPSPVPAPVPTPLPTPAPAPPPAAQVAPRELDETAAALRALPGAPHFGQIFLAGPDQVSAGEVFTLTVNVSEVENLYSAPLYLSYDPERLEFIRAREGDFLRQGQRPTIFTTSLVRPGTVIVGYKQGTSDAGASGGGDLFSVEFRALSRGAAQVEIDRINFRDPRGERIPVIATPKRVEVR